MGTSRVNGVGPAQRVVCRWARVGGLALRPQRFASAAFYAFWQVPWAVTHGISGPDVSDSLAEDGGKPPMKNEEEDRAIS